MYPLPFLLIILRNDKELKFTLKTMRKTPEIIDESAYECYLIFSFFNIHVRIGKCV